MALFEMCSLPAGQVDLHDARRSLRWQVDVEPFEISTFQVTVGQFKRVMGEAITGGAWVDARTPVVDLSWLDAVELCNAASAVDELQPAYTIHNGDVIWNVEAAGYRLPTEAEWEYACRAGTTGPHYAPLEVSAWTAIDGVVEPQLVGGKLPNDFGLYDTLGNAWEWCWNLLDPARYGDYRVFRGGGFADQPWSVRASTRRGGAPGMSHPDLGVRLARGGFAASPRTQGWSAAADRERGDVGGMLPSGWTPRAR